MVKSQEPQHYEDINKVVYDRGSYTDYEYEGQVSDSESDRSVSPSRGTPRNFSSHVYQHEGEADDG